MACTHPRIIHGRLVPCRECISCRKKRINDWAVRMFIEAKDIKFTNCSFVTLTYNDDSLPEYGLLCKRDYQLFLKRLRKYGLKFRYFMCGEYGSERGRPHFHFIFFGVPYTFEARDLVEKAWKDKGFIKFKPFHIKNAKYVAKYCVKQFGKYKVHPETGEVFSEFVEMSRMPGLGFKSFDDNALNYFMCKTIKIGNFNYSIPSAFIRKCKEIGMRNYTNITILYNEERFPSPPLSDFKLGVGSLLSSKFGVNIDRYSNIEFISFKDYFLHLETNQTKEYEYCKRKNVFSTLYYKEQFKYKYPSVFNQKYFEYSGVRSTHAYLCFFKRFLYNHFDYLFY